MESIESAPSQDEIQALLAGPEFFYCRRERCTMKKTTCLRYQKQINGKLKYPHFLAGDYITHSAAERANCWDCKQGKEIKFAIADCRLPIENRKLQIENCEEENERA